MSRFFELLYEADQRRVAAVQALRRRLGLQRPPTLLPYRGFGTPGFVRVRARVIEGRQVKPAAQRRTVVESALASYQRYATREIAGARVLLHWGARTEVAVSDEAGFVCFDVAPTAARGGWNDVTLALEGSSEAVAGHVFVLDERSEYGVISDLDDTVIVTNATNPLKRAHALFLSEARSRLPFEGVRAFYEALHEGSRGDRRNPIFYVSSSPWNLYEHVNEFLELQGIPYGPILLRDWGLSRTGFAPDGKHEHKLDKIREVLAVTSPLPFVLIGDSGQRDPELYESIAAAYPDRIQCVYIRHVTSRAARADQLASMGARLARLGVEFVTMHDTVQAARHAASRGWILWDEVSRVVEERALDEDG